MVEDFDAIKDINQLLVTLDHMYEELINPHFELVGMSAVSTKA